MLLKMEIPPPEILRKPLLVPNKTLMGPGPSNYSQRVLDAIGNPVLGHMHPECFQIMDDIKEGLKYLFQTRNPVTLCISASGHGGLEASLFNVIDDGDVILIGVTGIWGQRAADMASRLGADVRLCEAKLGCALTLDEIQNAFDIHKPKIFFLAHGDSSTGVIQINMKEIGELCKRYNCLLIVDCVASLGGVEFYMDDWKIDVAYSASQKVLGAPPGLCPISFSPKAMHKINTRQTKIKSYYWDINLLGQYWNCFGGSSRIYHHTISTTLLYGLREALSHICGQGLKSIIRKHMDCSIRLQKGIEDMGLEMFVTEPSYRLSTINSIKIPRGVDWRKVSQYAAKKYFLEISGGLGPTAEIVFRIGLLGENATIQKVDLTLLILREAIQNTSNITLSEKSKI